MEQLQRTGFRLSNGFTLFFFLLGLFLPPSVSQAQNSNCKEYIYLNSGNFNPNTAKVHKFEVGNSGPFNEVLVGGNAWYPGTSTPDPTINYPHGLGTDRNGFLYIGTSAFLPNDIRRFDGAGNLKPTSEFVINNPGNLLTNVDSYDGFIYSNGGDNKIYKWNPCTGAAEGFIQLGDGSDDWGLSIDGNGKFYVTNSLGRIFVFTPTAADFTANTTYQPVIDLGANPSYGGLSPAYSLQGLQGITADPSGNIYVVEGNRDVSGTPSRLLKFSPTFTFLAASPIDNNGADGAGWNQMVGVVYSTTTNRVYTSSLNPTEDCLYSFNTDLSPAGAVVGPEPSGLGGKGLNILKECCPTSGTLNESVCGVTIGQRISLADLINTNGGVIGDGQWTEVGTSTGLTFNDCDLTVTVTGNTACGSFTITNVNTPNKTCADYTITLNVSILPEVTAQVISGNQTVCPTDDPVAFTVTLGATTTPSGPTIKYQWQSSTTSSTAGFSNIPSATSDTYDSGPVSQTTYFRVIAYIDGCSNGMCSDTSNVLTLTTPSNCCLTPTTIQITQTTPTCTGSTSNNNGKITLTAITNANRFGVSTGATYSGTPNYAAATAIGSLPQDLQTNIPNTGGTYTIRFFNGSDGCYKDTTITVYPINCAPCIKTIMYLCGFNKYNDALSFDHGMIDYLRAKGHTVTPAQVYFGTLQNPETGNPINAISTFDKILVSHSAYFDVRDNVAFLLDSLKATTSGVLMLTSAGHVDLGIGTADGFDHPSGNIWIENNTSSILPTGLPNGVVAIYNDSTTVGLDGYSSIVGWCSGVGSGAIIGAYRTSQPDPRVSYVGYKKGTTLANNTTAPGNRFFLGYLVEGASNYQPQIQVTDPNNFFTAEARLILDEAIEQTCPCCTAPLMTNVSADIATCTNGVTNNNAAVHVTGITGMAKYAYGTNGTTGLYASTATPSTASSINITGLANPSVATTYTFRIWASDTTCYNDTTVVLTPSVCPPCSITATFTQNICNNNGTTATGADDYFTVTVSSVSATNGGTSGKYEVVLNGTTVLNAGGTAYGTSVTVGTSTTFLANGSTTYQLTVRDLDMPTCATNVFTTTASASCSVVPCPTAMCIPITITRTN